jgi:hypothetical protein
MVKRDFVRIEYPLSPEYGKTWTEEMALRELIANEMDAVGDQFTMALQGDVLSITDEGNGLLPRHLVLGISEKERVDAIGQFGEGLKMAALVYAGQKGAPVYIKASDREMWFTCEDSETFGTRVLVLTWRPTTFKTKGTLLQLQKVKSGALEDAKSRFLKFSTNVKWLDQPLGILDEPGAIYVAGVKIQQYPHMLFGYAIQDPKLMNRDRTTLDYQRLLGHLCVKLAECTVPTVIDRVLDACGKKQVTETEIPVLFSHARNERAKLVWQERFRTMYGKKVALAIGDEADLLAKDRGYRVVRPATDAGATATLVSLGAVRSDLIEKVQKDQQKAVKVRKKELPQTTRKKWGLAVRLAKWAARQIFGTIDWPKVRLVKRLEGENHEATYGVWVRGQIQILLSRVEVDPLEALIGYILHEYAHKVSRAQDRTREFENTLTSMVGTLATPRRYRANAKPKTKKTKEAA